MSARPLGGEREFSRFVARREYRDEILSREKIGSSNSQGARRIIFLRNILLFAHPTST
jgi:hypothetical protein